MLDDKQGAAQSADTLIFECLFCIVLYRCVCLSLSLFFFIFRPTRWSSLLVRDGHFLFMYNLQLLDLLLLHDQRKRLRSAYIPLVKEAKPSVCPFLLSCYPLSLSLSFCKTPYDNERWKFFIIHCNRLCVCFVSSLSSLGFSSFPRHCWCSCKWPSDSRNLTSIGFVVKKMLV